MDNKINFPKELGRAIVAAVVALLAGLLLKALGAGKWLTAAGSGAIGGVVAIALV
jgi:uncharacterized membrane protein YjjP (DUF1212 family)